MRRVGIFIIFGLFFALAMPAKISYAFPFDGIIRKGETHEGDLEVVGNNLIIEDGAVVDGDVSVFGGNVDILGEVDGDVSVIGGNVTVEGVISGDLVTFGGNISLDENASFSGDCLSIGGNVTQGDKLICDQLPFSFSENLQNLFGDFPGVNPPETPELPAIPDLPARVEERGGAGSILGESVKVVGRTLLLGALAWIISSIWGTNLKRVSHAVVERPIASAIVGVLSTGAFASVMTLLSVIFGVLVLACGIGLLGVPVLLVLAGLFIAAGIIGWVAIGQLFGNRLNSRLRLSEDPQVNNAVTGTVILTLVLGLVGALPSFLGSGFFAWMFITVFGSIGLGAATLTKLGRQNYPALPAGNLSKIDSILEESLLDESK